MKTCFLRIFLFAFSLFPFWSCQKQTQTPTSKKDTVKDTTSSVNWADQVVYFLMTDRFFDANPKNNDLGQGEYDPMDDSKFQGGDLQGITQNLDYIEKLGATAVWITPPVLNQVWNPDSNYTGYHGYWASHFKQVDPHYGTLEDYKALAGALHSKNKYLIQDVVVNHTGDYFRYEGGYDAKQATKYYHNYTAPIQSPFDQNNPNNPDHLAADIYHFTPAISDFKADSQRLTWQMSGLDDLNTSNPIVRQALVEAYQYWIEEVGVDGFRFDTAVYTEHDFWREFLFGTNSKALGIKHFAKNLGKPDFFTFGEAWVTSKPFDNEAETTLQSYLDIENTEQEQARMDGIINFPLQITLKRVFAGGTSTSALSYRLFEMQKHFPEPAQRVNFMDNHDMSRFRAVASEAAYQQALLLLMSIPGVPVIYQGTEQGILATRQNMFDQLHTDTEAFQFVQKLIALRQQHPVMRHGDITTIADGNTCPNLYLAQISDPNNDLNDVYIAFNTSKQSILAHDIDLKTKLDRQPTQIESIYSLVGGAKFALADQKLAYLQLPPREGFVFRLKDGAVSPKPTQEVVSINTPLPKTITTPTLSLTGKFQTKADSICVLMDGKIGKAQKANVNKNEWTREIKLANLPNGVHYLQAVAYQGGAIFPSEKIPFTLDLPTHSLFVVSDPVGDDKGKKGTYQYPTHETFAGQMDIKKVDVLTTGNNLKVKVQMAHPLSTVWNPSNGFDHVLLLLFLDMPNQKGMTVLPKLHATMPKDMNWDYAVLAGGWSVGMFNTQGANVTEFATNTDLKPTITALPKENVIQLDFSGAALGYPETLEGLQLYLATWDGGGEGELRPLKAQAESFSFGGGKEGDALIMDEVILR